MRLAVVRVNGDHQDGHRGNAGSKRAEQPVAQPRFGNDRAGQPGRSEKDDGRDPDAQPGHREQLGQQGETQGGSEVAVR
jgi:hypothetical protein